jgi:tetrapyrrole methylase family protein / MazG family protein
MDHSHPAGFSRLLSIIRRLRAPDGCPWDREQTPASLRGSVIEEAYECAAAITSGDEVNLKEELGDLLMVAGLIACMKEEQGAFTVEDVLDTVSEKLIRRHPHVFHAPAGLTSSAVVHQWDRIKEEEKPGRSSSALSSLPGHLPPLEKAARIQARVSKVGFDWKSAAPVWDKLREEISELEAAVGGAEPARVEDEVGDILFTVVNLARLLGVDAGVALHATNEKFSRRFKRVEDLLAGEGLTTKEAGLDHMDHLWNQVKAEERKASK